MKHFFLTFFASLAAIFVGGFLILIISLLILISTAEIFSTEKSVMVKPNSILRIDLKEIITDAPQESLFGNFDPYTMTVTPTMTMLDALSAIEAAAGDDNIKGIYLNLNPLMNIGLANSQELKKELEKFKESGKFIVSYNDFYTQSTYYLSSVADKIFLNPQGSLAWIGMSSQVMFFKGALDKLGIQPEIVRCGEFKSAVEPFISDKMSPENRLQMEQLLGSIWGNIVSEITSSRGTDSTTLQKYASDLTISGAKAALECKLIDQIGYADEVLDHLKKEIDNSNPEFISLGKYSANSKLRRVTSSSNKIAVIYADGEIIDGVSKEGEIGSKTFSHKLVSAREDDNIKAVVIRINSPGGSALASEVIWREMSLLRQKKPVIVSMGNYAASGGYYIAAPADVIIADKATLTGSIGVFGLMFDAQKAMKDKLGITVDVVKTNQSADMMTPFRAQSSAEKIYLQNSVDSVYSTFVSHVAQGRNLSTQQVLKIASGRVWSGIDALSIGLIDGYGGIKDAILLAGERAGIAENFAIEISSQNNDAISQAIMTLFSTTTSIFKSPIADALEEYNDIKKVIDRQGIQAIMPYKMTIE